MATQTIVETEVRAAPGRHDWVHTGLKAAIISVIAVLLVQAAALAAWPDIAQFKPLDSYLRSALFTVIPAFGATAVFAWLVKHQDRPTWKFLVLSAVILLLSFIPDFALPLPGKSLLGSSIAAFMHLVAGVTTVAAIVWSYQRKASL